MSSSYRQPQSHQQTPRSAVHNELSYTPPASSGGGGGELLLDHGLGSSRMPSNIVYCGISSSSSSSVPSPVIATPCGKVVLVSNVDDCHDQLVIRGHETNITAIDATSASGVGAWTGTNSGAYIGGRVASGAEEVGTTAGCIIATGHRASSDGVAYLNLWSVSTGGLLRSIRTPHRGVLSKGPNRHGDRAPAAGANDGYISAVKFSPDGALVATLGNEGSLAVFDCAGGSKVAGFQETMESSQAISLVWGRHENGGTRDQKYTLYVPFTTGVRLFSIQFSVRTLTYEVVQRECQVPGGGGRMGGFQRTYLSCATVGNDLLCGASSGELLIFNVVSGVFRAGLQMCQHGITAIVVPPSDLPFSISANPDPEADRTVYISGGDGSIKRLIGHDSQWRVHTEMLLPARVLGMVMEGCPEVGGSEGGGATLELYATTTSGHIYRILAGDLTYTVAAEGPTGVVTSITTPPIPRHGNGDNNSSDTSTICFDEIVTCSSDGWVRMWDLNGFTVKAAYGHPSVLTALHQSATSTLITSSGNGHAPGLGAGMAHGNGVSRRLREIHGALHSNNSNDPTTTSTSKTAAGEVVVPTVAVYVPGVAGTIVVGYSDGSMTGLHHRSTSSSSSADRAGSDVLEVLWTLTSAHNGPVTTMDISKQYIVSGGPGGAVRVWSWGGMTSPSGGKSAPVLVAQMQDHRGAVTGVKVDHCVECLVHTTGSSDQTHRIYDLSQAQVENNFRAQQTGYKHTGGAPAQRQGVLATNAVTAPRCVRVHASTNLSAALPPQQQYGSTVGATVGASGGAMLCLTQRFDGSNEAVVGTADGRVLLLDIDDDGTQTNNNNPNSRGGGRGGGGGGTKTIPSPGPSAGPACAVAITPSWSGGSSSPSCRTLLAVGHADGRVIIYDVSPEVVSATPRLLHSINCHTAQVTTLTWSADGKQLFTAGADGELFAWNMFW